MDQLPTLAGKRLLCHCAVEAQCHGDVLVEAFHRQANLPEAQCSITVGVFREPAEFATLAAGCKHPFDALFLDDLAISSLSWRMKSSPAEIASYRAAVLRFWTDAASELAPQEKALHRSLHPDVEQVVGGKRILLFSKMLTAIEFPSAELLVHHLCAGFPVLGTYPKTGVFPPASRVATYQLEDIWRRSHQVREGISHFRGHADDKELDEAVEKITEDEVAAGWLRGPVSPEELDKKLGCWTPSRRFGVRQGDKTRAIDDFAASGINEGLAACESIDPSDLDRIAANVRAHMEALSVPDQDRSEASPLAAVKRHSARTQSDLVCRMWDLAAAYRQLARSPKDAACTVIACWSVKQQRHLFFEQLPLAFGASSSVLSFNWIATALCRIVVGLLRLGATNFYDDFTVVEEEELAENAKGAFELLMRLLGWTLKDLPEFGPTAEPLGAVLDLSRSRKGIAVISNKERRVADITAEIDKALSPGGVSSSNLAKLRGRLLFSRSLCFARFGGAALRALGPACEAGSSPVVGAELRAALVNLRRYVRSAPPRVVRLRHTGVPVIFTDGSFETRGGLPFAGIGAVLLDPADRAFEFYAGVVPDSILCELTAQSNNPIFTVEALAVLVAKRLWAERLKERSCLVFVDNEATKAALIAGYSSQPIGAAVLQACVDCDLSARSCCWYDRVPSASNIADAPSRGAKPCPLPGWSQPVHLPVAQGILKPASFLHGVR